MVIVFVLVNKNYDVETQDLQVDTETTPQNDDTDELLISLIASRPPLYDHRLPTQSRHKHKRAALWDEVYNMMGGKSIVGKFCDDYLFTFFSGSMSVNDITKRWKYLRDRYIRVRKECNKTLPSGSAANSQPLKKCPHYMLMQFLNDVLDNKRYFKLNKYTFVIISQI